MSLGEDLGEARNRCLRKSGKEDFNGKSGKSSLLTFIQFVDGTKFESVDLLLHNYSAGYF
jgi:hypothetical protein